MFKRLILCIAVAMSIVAAPPAMSLDPWHDFDREKRLKQKREKIKKEAAKEAARPTESGKPQDSKREKADPCQMSGAQPDCAKRQ